MKELTPFRSFEIWDSKDDLYLARLRCQDARAELNEIISKIDAVLIEKMKSENIRSFETGPEEARQKIIYGQKKTEKLTNPGKLVKMLFSANEAERELSRNALSGGSSAWKIAQVRTLADTLGIEDLIETTVEDKIEVKAIPVNLLKGADNGK